MVDAKKGTTTIAIVCETGVVLASDRRASLGHLAMHETDKILPITKDIGMSIAGQVSDAQVLHKWLASQMELYKLNRNVEPTVEAAASLLSNVLYGGAKGFFPHLVMLTLGGKATKGYKIFSLDPSGSSLSDKYIAHGSGMELAYGVLEEGYVEGMSLEDAKKLILKAMISAVRRDVFSGDGIDIVVIDEKGYRKVDHKQFKDVLRN